jgi:hypothetical protein
MSRKFVLGFFAVSLLVVLVLAPFASSWPDGLESVAEKIGFIDSAEEPLVKGIFPDYEAGFLKSEYLKVVLPGVFGTAVTFAFTTGLYLILTRKGKNGGARVSR